MASQAAGMASADDQALVARVLAGDGGAFEHIMRRHNRRLFRAARAILRDDAEAEDALQDAYVRAYGALADFRGQARLATWLTRIAVNEALERLRRRRRDAPQPGAEPLPEALCLDTPEILAMRAETCRLIEDSIDHLPDAYRCVLVLRAVEGLSVEDTAASLGLSPMTVKTRLFRARQLLRRALAEQLEPRMDQAFAFDGARCDRIVTRVLQRLHLSG